jgi:hypothetical protein
LLLSDYAVGLAECLPTNHDNDPPCAAAPIWTCPERADTQMCA